MPVLDVPALSQLLGRRQLAPVHLLFGDDVRLVDRLVDAIEATIDPADRPFAVDRLHAGEPGGGPVDIVAAARSLPMLGDRRIVVVLRAERLLKPRRASKTTGDDAPDEDVTEGPADLGPLEDYVASPVDSTTLVFVATEIDRTRRLTKRLLQAAQITACGGFDTGTRRDGRSEAADFVRTEFEHAGRPIDPAAVQAVAARAGGDITKLRGDVDRLLIYTEGRPRVTAGDVAEVVAMAAERDDWAVVNAIADGDPARALRETAARLDRGDSPHGLVGQLRWWVSERLAPRAPERVPAALDALLRTDLALKSSGGDERVLIERLVAELTGRPVLRQEQWGRRR